MPDPPEIRQVIRCAKAVDVAEERLAVARLACRNAMHEAHAAGISIAALARALGVSRQRAQQLLRKPPP